MPCPRRVEPAIPGASGNVLLLRDSPGTPRSWTLFQSKLSVAPAFQLTLGATMDVVVPSASHTNKITGRSPHVSPSFGSVEYTGSGISFLESSVGHPPEFPVAPTARDAPARNTRQTIRAASRCIFSLAVSLAPRRRCNGANGCSNRGARFAARALSGMAPAFANDEAPRLAGRRRAALHRGRRGARRASCRSRHHRSARFPRSVQRKNAFVPRPVLSLHPDGRHLRQHALLLLAGDPGP